MNLDSLVHEYFHIVDESLDQLSNHQEGKIVNLPGWVLQKRTVKNTSQTRCQVRLESYFWTSRDNPVMIF